jgi:hypothetical protein
LKQFYRKKYAVLQEEVSITGEEKLTVESSSKRVFVVDAIQ